MGSIRSNNDIFQEDIQNIKQEDIQGPVVHTGGMIDENDKTFKSGMSIEEKISQAKKENRKGSSVWGKAKRDSSGAGLRINRLMDTLRGDFKRSH